MDIREQAIHEYLVEGKTYRQLAKKYNVSRSTINKWILIRQDIHDLPRSKRQHSYDLQQMTRKKIPKPQVPLSSDAEEKIRQLEQQLAYEKLRADALDSIINIAEKQGLLGWDDTDERINPETGRRQKKGLLGRVDE